MLYRVTVLVALALCVGVATPLSARAHQGGSPSIIVPLDHIDPGQPFSVIAADLGADANVAFTLTAAEHDPLRLGTRTAGPDGHFESTLDLPADFPLGYAELVASADDGSQASTWVLVGPRTESTPAPPGQPALWEDPAVLMLSAALAVGGVLLALTTIRASRRERAMAAALQGDARRPLPRKRRR